MNNLRQGTKRGRCAGWTMPEVVIAAGVVSVSLASLYLGIAQGFDFIRETRENLRATQILGEKMETIRLYTWDQITNGSVPLSFTNYDFPPALLQGGNVGVPYVGTLTISNAPITESYGSDLKQVTVQLSWKAGSISCQKQMTSLVSHYGMQNYIYTQK